MSSTPSNTSANNSNSSATFRVKYSDYVADITGSPKTTRKSATTGIGHHINPLHNPFPNQTTQQTGGMPQYGGGSDKCARCSKTVYLAEKKVGAGRSFHVSCFSCHTCKRKLDAATLSEHKGEIYCKSCYTKQFGAHGLISGVTMSTEIPVKPDYRRSNRSSYSSDLDDPVLTEQQTRQRINSTDNILRERYSGTQNNGINVIVDKKYQRPSSPTLFERDVQSNVNDNRHRSTYIGEEDRSQYIHKGAQLSYGSGASAIVDIPIALHPKQSDFMNDRTEIPINRQRSRSPSVTSNDLYRQQSSRDRQNDLVDDYSRVNINEINNNRNNEQYPTNNRMSAIASENPLTARTFHHSSSTSSFENINRNSRSSPNNFDREQHHSRDSSPSVNVNRNRSPSPTIGYISSSTTTRTSSSTYKVGTSRDPTSPYTPQHDYVNTRTSPNLNNQHSLSPQRNDQVSYGVNDLIKKTNIAKNVSPSGGNNFSVLGALANNPRQQYNDYDD